MKEMYLLDINDVYWIIASEVQQHDSLPQCPQNEKIEKLKVFKTTLEGIVFFLLLKKHDIQQTHKEKLVLAEKYISFFLSSRRPREHTFSILQGNFLSLPYSFINHNFLMVKLINRCNLYMVPCQENRQFTTPSNMEYSHQLLAFHNRILSTALKEVNVSSLSSQSGTNPVQENLCCLWQNSSVLQQSFLKLQKQQILQDQQLRQMYQQQQTFHSQQLLQFQQLIHRNQIMQQQLMQLQQQTLQLPSHQMSQLHQMTDANDLNMRQQMGMKTGVLQKQQSVGQRDGFHHLQVKSEISSPQACEAVYPQRQNLPAVDESKNIAYMPWNFQ